jgi:hypothetical protein
MLLLEVEKADGCALASRQGRPTMLAIYAFSTTAGMSACQIPIFPI